jgi:hypothetical protein
MMQKDLRTDYLELLKKVLTYSLWPEPGVPVEKVVHRRSAVRSMALSAIAKLLAPFRLQLVRVTPVSPEARAEGRIWPAHADTMVGLKRLDSLQTCIEEILRENVEGDLIETGVWRGGTAIFMRAVLATHGVSDRRLFVADSFQGLPKPDEQTWPEDKGDVHYTVPFLAISEEEVRNNFAKYGLLDDQVVFLKGWFKDTLPGIPAKKLALIRLDGDMYGSTMEALTSLYPRLSNGGFCVIDDYALEGCRKAVEDYRKKYSIEEPIHTVDWTGAYWRKEKAIH